MLHYSAIFLGIALAAVAVVFMLSVASSGLVYVLKIVFFITLGISAVCFILDLVKRMAKSKT